ncbi:hypothetical protein PV326_001134, partial [Microctonus aethiopoides]
DIHDVGGLYVAEREGVTIDSDKFPLSKEANEHDKEYLANEILSQSENSNKLNEIPHIYPELLVVVDNDLYKHYSESPKLPESTFKSYFQSRTPPVWSS